MICPTGGSNCGGCSDCDVDGVNRQREAIARLDRATRQAGDVDVIEELVREDLTAVGEAIHTILHALGPLSGRERLSVMRSVGVVVKPTLPSEKFGGKHDIQAQVRDDAPVAPGFDFDPVLPSEATNADSTRLGQLMEMSQDDSPWEQS